MANYLNNAMNCILELPLSSNKNNRPTTPESLWVRSAFNLLKAFIYELFLVWAKTLMIFVWCARVFVNAFCLPPAKVDRSEMEKLIRFTMAAGLLVILMTVLAILYAITSFSLKCVIEITIWINTLWASIILAFRCCRVLILLVTTVMVVTRLMYLFQIAVHIIHKVFGTSVFWFGHLDNRFTTNSIIRCCIFVYVLVWVTDTYALLYLTGLVILINRMTKSTPSTAK